MPRLLNAEDILPLIALLTPGEQDRLRRLMGSRAGPDSSVYAAMPPTADEFAAEGDALAWESEGWEAFR